MEKKYPFFFRSTVTLFGIMLFIYMLYVLRGYYGAACFCIDDRNSFKSFGKYSHPKKNKQDRRHQSYHYWQP